MLDSGVSYSPENYGMQRRNSDSPGIENSIAGNVKDVNENTASRHQNENTRPSIEKSMAKADTRSSIEKPISKKTKSTQVDPSQL